MDQIQSNLDSSSVEVDTRDLFAISFEFLKQAEGSDDFYDHENIVNVKKLIELYYRNINPDYGSIIENFKKKYIDNESMVEKNDSDEEKKGIGLVYDFIQNFDFNHKEFNIFVTGLEIHSLLYKPLDEKRQQDYEIKKDEVKRLIDEAKREKNMAKFKKAKEIQRNLKDEANFGGNMRSATAILKDTAVYVPDAEEAKAFYNQFLLPQKKEEFNRMVNNPNIFEYIDYCVETTAELIRVQPFGDGNKRTFRSLLNLMFKRRKLPPVYCNENEYQEYLDVLVNGMLSGDYTDLKHFYYFKICDSIYELDINPYLKKMNIEDNKKVL